MSWTKAYAHDENGNAIFGKIDVLLTSVREGKEVRMLLKISENPQQDYFTPAENLWIRGSTLYAQNATHVSVTSSTATGDLTFQEDPYYWMILVNTKGQLDMTRWLVGEHTPRGRDQRKVAVTWFVG